MSFAGGEALGFSPNASVSVVLEDDGTIVEDEDYFLCLPANTKFMLLNNRETWTPTLQGETTSILGCLFHIEHHYLSKHICFLYGGTGQPNTESVDLEVDGQDHVDGAESWHSAAKSLKHNLSNIILMSEADLQVSLVFLFYKVLHEYNVLYDNTVYMCVTEFD